MKEEALKLADSYEIRANFIISHHEKSGRVRMSTTNQAMVKRYKNTADMIRKLVAELDKREKEFQTTSNYSQLVLRTNEQLMLEVVLLRKANEQSHIDYRSNGE